MRIVLTGGGTGGHVVPNLAVIEGLKKKKDIELLYVGSKQGPEKKLVEAVGIDFKEITCGKIRRYFSWDNFVDMFKVPVGVVQARGILQEFKPDVVFSKGGYVSFPVAVAAWNLGIPVILHESDVAPGLSNKVSARFAKKICLSFEESKRFFQKYKEKILVTGNPVRKEVLKGDSVKGLKMCGFDKYRPVIMVMGGSQGAKQINNLIHESLPELLKKFQIVHLVGRGHLDIGIHQKGYKQFEFLGKELADVYAASEIVVSRGGANSLSEIAALNKKCLVIPLTQGSRGDQVDNAKTFSLKYGWSILQGEIPTDDFVKAIKMLAKNSNSKEKFLNGTKAIVDLILEIGTEEKEVTN